MAAASPPPPLSSEKRPRWLIKRKVINKYIAEARSLISTQEPSDVSEALSLLDSALALSPRSETALELKARSLLFLRRFREVADMLQGYVPSFKPVVAADDDGDDSNSLGSCEGDRKEGARLLCPNEEKVEDGGGLFRCFSVFDLKRKLMAGLNLELRSCSGERHWRYLILGQACYHLGLMDDAMVLLQTARRLATAASRRKSTSLSDDIFWFPNPTRPDNVSNSNPTESKSASGLLAHIKLLLRRRTAAVAALDAGLPSESIRHFSKILDGRRRTPEAFIAACFVGRSAAYRAAGRIADSIADCNRALSIDPVFIAALRARADLTELIRALPDCLRDLDHLKLLFDSILRDRKPHSDVRHCDLRALATRIKELRMRIASGGGFNVDYCALIGVSRGCDRSELERAYRLLMLKHKPDKAVGFVDRLEFSDEKRDICAVRDQARMSALILYRMLQKGYSSIMSAVVMEESVGVERQRTAAMYQGGYCREVVGVGFNMMSAVATEEAVAVERQRTAAVYQGGYCREVAEAGFGRAIVVKYEGLSC